MCLYKILLGHIDWNPLEPKTETQGNTTEA